MVVNIRWSPILQYLVYSSERYLEDIRTNGRYQYYWNAYERIITMPSILTVHV